MAGDKIVNFNVDLSKWNVEKPLKDVIWILMIDEPDTDYVKRESGIVLATKSTTRSNFRIGKVLKCGDKCTDVKEGDFVMLPPNVGMIGYKSIDGYKTLFTREETIMAVISFDGSKDEFIKHVQENLFATL